MKNLLSSVYILICIFKVFQIPTGAIFSISYYDAENVDEPESIENEEEISDLIIGEIEEERIDHDNSLKSETVLCNNLKLY